MLDDLDETLKTLLRERGHLDADEIDIAFDAPDREWASSVGKPTVNCYLYDIRENLQLRESEWIVERQENGRAATKRRPPRRYDLSYVCTAWTSDVEDEHRLLWRVLSTLVRFPVLPPDLLHGSLAHSEYPIATQVAQPDGLLRNPAEVWSALDNRIRASVNFVATLPVDDMEPISAPLVLTKRVRIRPDNRSSYETIQIAGHVRDASGSAQSHAVVQVRDHAFMTRAGPHGEFWFVGLPPGDYTLVAEVDGMRGERDVQIPGSDYDVILHSTPETAASESAPARKGGKSRGKL